MTPATTLFAWNCIRPVLYPFLYFPYAGLTYPILLDSRISLVAFPQLTPFSVLADYGSVNPCVPPSATRQRHHTKQQDENCAKRVSLCLKTSFSHSTITNGRKRLGRCDAPYSSRVLLPDVRNEIRDENQELGLQEGSCSVEQVAERRMLLSSTKRTRLISSSKVCD